MQLWDHTSFSCFMYLKTNIFFRSHLTFLKRPQYSHSLRKTWQYLCKRINAYTFLETLKGCVHYLLDITTNTTLTYVTTILVKVSLVSKTIKHDGSRLVKKGKVEQTLDAMNRLLYQEDWYLFLREQRKCNWKLISGSL